MFHTIITGASKGIGKELANVYAQNGNNLILVARSGELLEALKIEILSKYKLDIHILPLDLTQNNCSQILLNYCQDNNLRINNLVNNAGFGDFEYFVDQDLTLINNMISVNITALTDLTYTFLNEIINNKGRIMLIAIESASPKNVVKYLDLFEVGAIRV